MDPDSWHMKRLLHFVRLGMLCGVCVNTLMPHCTDEGLKEPIMADFVKASLEELQIGQD